MVRKFSRILRKFPGYTYASKDKYLDNSSEEKYTTQILRKKHNDQGPNRTVITSEESITLLARND